MGKLIGKNTKIYNISHVLGITDIVYDSGVWTVTTNNVHDYHPGNSVYLWGMDGADELKGIFEVFEIPNPDQITIKNTVAVPTDYISGGSIGKAISRPAFEFVLNESSKEVEVTDFDTVGDYREYLASNLDGEISVNYYKDTNEKLYGVGSKLLLFTTIGNLKIRAWGVVVSEDTSAPVEDAVKVSMKLRVDGEVSIDTKFN